ncbi:MAG: tail fiber domain-containing protein, partial [Chitinophagales bacterium]|nr:tail fiber domain-containing protein [Chitinophagales bacterium]
IMKLRPVSYNQNPEILHQIWGTPDSLLKNIDHTDIKNQRFVGLIAQEVERAMKESGYEHFPGIDVPKSDKEVYSMRYGDFIIPLIKAVQEQQKQIELQQKEIEALKVQNEEFRNLLTK